MGVVGWQCHLRLGIVDGCCSTSRRVSDGDLQNCHFTAVDVVLELSLALTTFTSISRLPPSAMLNSARVKGQVLSQDQQVKTRAVPDKIFPGVFYSSSSSSNDIVCMQVLKTSIIIYEHK